MDGAGRLVRAEVSLRVEPPVETLDDPRAIGLVNPTGSHPLTALVPGTRTLLDIFPVSWERWLRLRPGVLPPGAEPWQLRSNVEAAMARSMAAAAGARLPTEAELRAAWGPARFPWGAEPDPAKGAAAPLRWGQVPELGGYPPNPFGFFDLGCALWVWTEEGTLRGGLPDLAEGGVDAAPSGLRLATTL